MSAGNFSSFIHTLLPFLEAVLWGFLIVFKVISGLNLHPLVQEPEICYTDQSQENSISLNVVKLQLEAVGGWSNPIRKIRITRKTLIAQWRVNL